MIASSQPRTMELVKSSFQNIRKAVRRKIRDMHDLPNTEEWESFRDFSLQTTLLEGMLDSAYYHINNNSPLILNPNFQERMNKASFQEIYARYFLASNRITLYEACDDLLRTYARAKASRDARGESEYEMELSYSEALENHKPWLDELFQANP